MKTWYSTDWEEYCSWIEERGKHELVQLLILAFGRDPNFKKAWINKYPRTGYSKVPKKEICEFITNYKPHPVVHACTNTTTLTGDVFEDYAIDELIYVMENGKRYCFTYEEIERLDKNPYTNQPLPNKSDLLRGKRKRQELFDSTPRLRKAPESLEEAYARKKEELKRLMQRTGDEVPILRFERMPNSFLVKFFNSMYPDILHELLTRDKREVLINIYQYFIENPRMIKAFKLFLGETTNSRYYKSF